MKTVCAILSVVILASAAHAVSGARPAVSAGIRRHVDHTVFEELPFDGGDLSYILGWEYHDQGGCWQLLVGYTPEVGDGTLVDYVITPQLNLLLQDRGWQAGVGILGSYIVTETDEEWTDVYWQLMLGFILPLPVAHIEIMAYYPFDSWGDVGDFDGDDIEFGAILKFFY